MLDTNRIKEAEEQFDTYLREIVRTPLRDFERDTLRNMYYENKPINEISQILKRQPNAIKFRLKKLALLS